MKYSRFRICHKSRFDRAMRNQFRCEPQRLVYFLFRRVAHGSSDQRGLRTLGGHASQLRVCKSATPGKMITRIKVVDAETGNKLSTGQRIGRYLAYYPATLPLFFGLIWVAFDKRKQGWHDKLARTLVVEV